MENSSNDDYQIIPDELKNIAWPACYIKCRVARFLGVSECDFICPEKFQKELDTNGEK